MGPEVAHSRQPVSNHGPMTAAGTTINLRPETEDGYQAALAHLQDEWAGWAARTACPFGADAFEQMIHYKWGYLDRHLVRWTCADVDEVLLELFPAKVVVDTEALDDVIAETTAFVTFLAETDLLDQASDDPHVLTAHLADLESRFRHRMADRSLYSPGKRLWTAALDEGIDLDDQAAVSGFIERFNNRSPEERRSMLDRPPTNSPGGWGTGRFAPPGTGRIVPRGTGRITPPGTPPRPKPSKGRRRRRR